VVNDWDKWEGIFYLATLLLSISVSLFCLLAPLKLHVAGKYEESTAQ